MPAINLFSKIYKYILFLYIFLFLIEILLPGFISNNFNLNIVLELAILFGVASIFFHKDSIKSDIKFNFFIVILSIIFGIYISFNTIEINLFEKFILVLGICFFIISNVYYFVFESNKKLKITLPKIKINFVNYKKIFYVLLILFFSTFALYKIYSKLNLKENLVNSEVVIKIFDTEDDKKDAKEFAKKLNNLGYYKVYYGSKSNEKIQDVYIYFNDKYFYQVEIISSELSKLYDNINLRPAKKGEEENIIIVFGK